MSADVRTFQRRPVQVEAVQVNEDNVEQVAEWMADHGLDIVATLDGDHKRISWAGQGKTRPGTATVGDTVLLVSGAFSVCTDPQQFAEEYEPADQPNPLHEVGVLRTRTDGLAREMEAVYRESLRLAQVCDRQQAEIHRLRMSEPVELEAVFEHCAGCPGDHPTPEPDPSAPVRDDITPTAQEILAIARESGWARAERSLQIVDQATRDELLRNGLISIGPGGLRRWTSKATAPVRDERGAS